MRDLSIVGLLLAALVLRVPRAAAQDGMRGALSRTQEALPGPATFARVFAVVDFDNDSQPDGAVLSQSGLLNGQRLFRIDLHLTAGKNFTITFSSAEQGLSISALDLNHDGSPDLVVEKAFTHQRLAVYLNDGHGAFQKASQAFFGPDDSEPLWRAGMSVQPLPMLFLPPTRSSEFAATEAAVMVGDEDGGVKSLWPVVLAVQCGARAPAASRAPPLLSL